MPDEFIETPQGRVRVPADIGNGERVEGFLARQHPKKSHIVVDFVVTEANVDSVTRTDKNADRVVVQRVWMVLDDFFNLADNLSGVATLIRKDRER